MSWDPDIGPALARARLNASPDEVPLFLILTPVPLDLAAKSWRLVAAGLRSQGWDGYFREETGLAVLWVRPVVSDDGGDDGATDD